MSNPNGGTAIEMPDEDAWYNHGKPYHVKDLNVRPGGEHVKSWRERVGSLSKSKPAVSSSHKHTCPLCGERGDDLVFAFYCSNIKCKNYSK